jgi:hypothetical protein
MGKTRVVVTELPKCDLCEEVARYDAKLPGGPWAYLCETHFFANGCKLGLGRGQRLVLQGEGRIIHWQGIPVEVELKGGESLEFQTIFLPDWTILFVEPQDKDRKEVLRLLKEEGLRILKKTKKRIYFED